jgi:hypothetical protein
MASAVRVGISDGGIADLGLGIWNRILAADFSPTDSRFQIPDFKMKFRDSEMIWNLRSGI